eukprot:616817_1
MLTHSAGHSSPVRSKRFSFNPNTLMQPLLGADPLIVSTLQALGDKLRDDKFCELAVISTNNQSVEIAIKWILNKMQKSRQTPSLKPKINQSTSNTSPILMAASPVATGMNVMMKSIKFCNMDEDVDEDDRKLEDEEEAARKRLRHTHSIPPLSIGKSSYNEEDELMGGVSATTTATLITITPTNTIGNLSRARSLLSPYAEMMEQDQDEIIPMSPSITMNMKQVDADSDDSDESRTPTPPSFAYGFSNVSISRVQQPSDMIVSSLIEKCVLLALSQIELREKAACSNGFDFNNIATRNRNQNNYKIVRFDDEKQQQQQHKKMVQIIPKYVDKLWIWNAIHCLDISPRVFDILPLLCSHSLSRTISFLSFNMRQCGGKTDAPFHLIAKYFPHLEYFNLRNFDYISQHRESILELFKLHSNNSQWERVESSLIKLRAIHFCSCDDLFFKLLAETTVHLNIGNPTKFVFESLFTQLIVLQINKCSFESITHLQILLNGCCAVQYLSLCHIRICSVNDLTNLSKSSRHQSSFIDRVERTMANRNKQHEEAIHKRQKEETQQTTEYGIRIDYLCGVPIIRMPKSVKYLRLFHKYRGDSLFNEMVCDEGDESSISFTTSNQSTPVLFAMDGVMDSPQHKHIKHKHNKSIKLKAKMEYPTPPFYCNLSRNRKRLVHLNCQINDGYCINQMAHNHFKSLRAITLNYTSNEHNGYLNFAEFVAFYSAQYSKWKTQNCTQNTRIILSNALYDEFKLSLNKTKLAQFFQDKFCKNETQIIKEDQFNAPHPARYKAFVNKIAKATNLFESQQQIQHT